MSTNIIFASSKGGVGKTTANITLASVLAKKGESSGVKIGVVDADPNQHTAKWALREGCPQNIINYGDANELTIIDIIDNAQSECDFVLVDLEGTASMTVASAISRAHLVVVLCQGSQNDADEAIKTIKLIMSQSKVINRQIKYSVLFTRTSAAIRTRNLQHIQNQFKKANIDMFSTTLVDREAFRAVNSFGGTIHDLDPREVSGIDKAVTNAKDFAAELLSKIKQNEEMSV